MFVWNSFDSEYRSVMKLFLSLDYIFMTGGMVADYSFQPYLGANIGYMSYESIGFDEDGLLYGGQAGILFEMTEYVNFDIGYRYSLSSEEALNHTSELLFGVQYEY
jgi:hemolysin activation/secretion protein